MGNTEQGKLLFWMFTGKWDTMAEHFVDLDGKMTLSEKKALLLERLSYRVTSASGLKEKKISGNIATPGKALHPRGFIDFWKALQDWGTTEQGNWDSGKKL